MALGFDALSENPLSGIFIVAGGPVNYADSLSVGSYSLVGKDITDVKTSASTAYADSLSVGSYAIAGNTVSDSRSRADSLSTGAYVISGKTVSDSQVRADSLSTGAYVISGKTVSDSVVRADSLSTGAYTIAGQSITDSKSVSDSLQVGSYIITGKNITDVKTGAIAYLDNLSTGDYSIAGQQITDDYQSGYVTPWWPLVGGAIDRKKYEKEAPEVLPIIEAIAQELPKAPIKELRIELKKRDIAFEESYKVMLKAIIKAKIREDQERDDEEALFLLL